MRRLFYLVSSSERTGKLYPIMVVMIIILGFGLRIYQIGTDSFWVDEVGVIDVASSSSLPDFIKNIRNHIMAMPLDYVIASGILKLGHQEWLLRLPEAIWGTLSIPLTFLLFSKLRYERVGLIASAFLAVSPFHIQYSQELRFYAPLVFFTLLSTWLLICAIENPTVQNWVLFTAAALVGIFFHVYVFFSIIPGLFFILDYERRTNVRLRVLFIRSLMALLIGLIIGLLSFGGVNPERVPMDLFEPSTMNAIAVGLGWIPFYSPVTPDITWLWGTLCLLCELAGILVMLKLHQGRLILLSLACQIAIVILAPLVKGYFLSPRNLIHLLPWMFFFAAVGVDWIWGLLVRLLKEKSENQLVFQKTLIQVGMGTVFAACLIPALYGYYTSDKGSAKEISQIVKLAWKPNMPIYVMPGNEHNLFKYYMMEDLEGKYPSGTLAAKDWGMMTDLSNEQLEAAIVITGEMAPPGYREFLIQENYQNIYQSKQAIRFPHEVWVKVETGQ